MDINLMEVLPVSKPPPENALRAGNPGSDVRRSDSPTFEQTLRARQKEEKQTQAQAEAAASQTAGATAQTPAGENETRPEQNSAPAAEAISEQPTARINGGLPALLQEGVLLPAVEGDLPAVMEGESQPADGVQLQPLPVADEGALVEGGVDFASALEQSLSQPAEETVVQSQSNTEVKSEKPVTTELKSENKAENLAKTKFSGEAQQNPAVEVKTVTEHPLAGHSQTIETAVPLRAESVPVQGRTLVDMVRQIAGQMEASIQQGRSSLRVQLHPQELGGIDIRFASSSQGVHVTVYAEQASTGRLLEAQLNQLRQSLSEAGVTLAQLNIHHESPSHQPHSGFHGHNPRGRSFDGGGMERGGDLLMEHTGRWQNLSVSGVDYRI
ncbi:MAG: flagellar hook-length control protein FliK [Chloroflexota bacterium]